MGKYFADEHASAASQLDGTPCGLEDSPKVAALRGARTYEDFLALGDALCYQLRYRDAIEAYTLAATMSPKRLDAYRRRAGRYLTTLQPVKAMDDLMRCQVLGGEARDLFYRMGLCLYLSGEYREAMEEFAAEYDQWDDEMRIALIYWHTLSAWRARAEPTLLQEKYHPGMEVGHHTAYDFCMAVAAGYIELSSGMERLERTEEDLEYSILTYGLGGFLARQGHEDEAAKLLHNIIGRDSFWISYAYLAAWNDKRRLAVGEM